MHGTIVEGLEPIISVATRKEAPTSAEPQNEVRRNGSEDQD